MHVLKDKNERLLHVDNIMKLTMLECLRSLIWDTCQMAVQGAPSSCSSFISLSATRLSLSLLLPLQKGV